MTAIETLLTYLAFADNFDYDINIYQVAIEPHVRNLIKFLNNAGANITLNVDHSIVVKPSKIQIKNHEFTIIPDYIAA
ncbi:MAG: UDP-N-acetylglucosamine 1-carboxyvinyltransferase [candidate division CPR1 bacterium ADurb.Bin160]|uniref:UDP-N-acetylglucosamine 1-carboxyvinyltransferase n=1 Tax=candidate division CPR1 bacterium ADurb.Bin160 TaxID=1852826 RepID=A0A1V5ZNL5_9BACT|nr:MAG: UDP-N-acetylglucosamine 1-carboxyvinyltransferase [candidate division CPR1 bacterium ADurb.Bin160]